MVQNENKHTFINFLTRKGKKGKIEKIYKNVLLNLKQPKKLNKKPTIIFDDVLTILKPKVQMKAISRFKSTIQPMKETRQTFIALKWLTSKSVIKYKNKAQSITTEIQNTLNKTSQSYLQKTDIYQEAQKLKFMLRRPNKKN